MQDSLHTCCPFCDFFATQAVNVIMLYITIQKIHHAKNSKNKIVFSFHKMLHLYISLFFISWIV